MTIVKYSFAETLHYNRLSSRSYTLTMISLEVLSSSIESHKLESILLSHIGTFQHINFYSSVLTRNILRSLSRIILSYNILSNFSETVTSPRVCFIFTLERFTLERCFIFLPSNFMSNYSVFIHVTVQRWTDDTIR